MTRDGTTSRPSEESERHIASRPFSLEKRFRRVFRQLRTFSPDSFPRLCRPHTSGRQAVSLVAKLQSGAWFRLVSVSGSILTKQTKIDQDWQAVRCLGKASTQLPCAAQKQELHMLIAHAFHLDYHSQISEEGSHGICHAGNTPSPSDGAVDGVGLRSPSARQEQSVRPTQ